MGELIRREAAAKPLDFSGERLTAAISGQVEVEHYHRYLLARDYCRGLDVLDCASGEGYGSALLAQVAQSVVGVEIDAVSVEAARTEFTYPNLSFQQGDARALPLPDASVDVAISFETLEHLTEQDQFLSELRRVLRPDGLLIISTPDRDIYSPIGTVANPYHRLELTRVDFEALLRRHFINTALAGQRAIIGSVILGAQQDAPARSFERRGDNHIEASDHMARAMYLIALASNAPLLPLRNSIYIYRSDLDTDSRIRFEAEIGRRAAEQEALEAQQANLSAKNAASAQVVELEIQIIESNERANEIRNREAYAVEAVEVLQRQEKLLQLQVSDLEHRLLESDKWANRSREQEAYVTETIEVLQRQEKLLQSQILRVEHSREEVEARVVLLEHRGEALEQYLANALMRAAHAERLNTETNQQLTAELTAHSTARQTADHLIQRLGQIEDSSIWRGSYPIRRFGSRFPTVARGLRVSTKVVWWAATFQLLRRYRLWRDSRALQYISPLTRELDTSCLQVNTASDVAPVSLLATSVIDGINLPHSHKPVVSLIISTYGQLEMTLGCLKSITACLPLIPIEIIVVDDAYSGPEDMSVLQYIPGILLLRNAANLGFLLSCNKAARTARGRYIHMLNNDTELQPGSIDALVELLDERLDIGMAGSKLLFPNKQLQEAGGILWTDATGWNYGRGEDPDRPEFNYVREVDYCSGASIMVRRELFESLGGFDEVFAPAYYEDADLAFRIRLQGYKVVYEPRSVVVHHEGVSHGTDVTSGVKAHQLVNQKRMLARWEETLAKENYESGQHVMRARDRAKARKIILVLEHYTLEPDRDAGSRSTMGIIDSLLTAGWVVKFWPLNRAYNPVYTTAMERRGIEVIDHRWPGDLATWMQSNGLELDHVLVVRPDTAAMTLPAIMANVNAPLSFYGVDLHFARVRRQALLDGNLDLMHEAAYLERLERRVWRSFDLVIYPSEAEAATVREMSPGTRACGIIPFCFDASPPRTIATEGRSVLFVAGFAHPPNVDAAMFLIKEIIPLLETRVGPVTVTLAGSNPTESVRKLAGKDVTVTGYVTDEELATLYKSHRASVVPLRFGAGVKGKVVESLSHGLPFVTTSTGSQGIEGLSEVVPVRDDANEIAQCLALLLTDDEAWLRQSQAQTMFAVQRYSRTAMQKSVLNAFEMVETMTKTFTGAAMS
ncbi:MAG: methyltransferase domain-containing protein [Janthinobacterium lividum]